MEKTILRSALAGVLFLATSIIAKGDFRSQLLADNPQLYFRLNETVSTPSYWYATNLGSTAAASFGFYNGLEQGMKQQPGVLAGNAGAKFDGVSQYALTTSGVPVNVSAPFTVEVWVKPGTSRASGSLVCPFGSLYRSGNNAKGWIIYQDADGWNYRQGNSAGYTINIKGGGAPTVGNWYHLAATFDGTTVLFYVNGVQVATGGNPAFEPNVEWPLGIGARGDGAFQFPGSVDEAAVYGSVLTAADIRRITRRLQRILPGIQL